MSKFIGTPAKNCPVVVECARVINAYCNGIEASRIRMLRHLSMAIKALTRDCTPMVNCAGVIGARCDLKESNLGGGVGVERTGALVGARVWVVRLVLSVGVAVIYLSTFGVDVAVV